MKHCSSNKSHLTQQVCKRFIFLSFTHHLGLLVWVVFNSKFYSLSWSDSLCVSYIYTHTHKHTLIYIYIYIYIHAHAHIKEVFIPENIKIQKWNIIIKNVTIFIFNNCSSTNQRKDKIWMGGLSTCRILTRFSNCRFVFEEPYLT